MTIYRQKAKGQFYYDFRYMGVRYTGRTLTTDRPKARWFEAQAKLHVRRELGGIPQARTTVSPSQPVSTAPLCVYFIQRGDAIKIGKSRNVPRRLRGLQVNHPDRLTLLGSVEISTAEFERSIHRVFADSRISGEWFAASPRLLGFIAYVLARGLLKTVSQPLSETGSAPTTKERQNRPKNAWRQHRSKEVGDVRFAKITAKIRGDHQ